MKTTHIFWAIYSLILTVGIGRGVVAQPGSDQQQKLVQSRDTENEQPAPASIAPISEDEARVRAQILHETLHGSLQVMHRDFFREDEDKNIPSRSLEDVFRELKRHHGISIRWIAVDLEAMNIDNKPKTDFEKEAVRVLKSGKPEYESVIGNEFHYAGKIRLSATCLSCHASQRSSNDDRAAGLIISFPLKPSH